MSLSLCVSCTWEHILEAWREEVTVRRRSEGRSEGDSLIVWPYASVRGVRDVEMPELGQH